jgi:hypothetical protein
MRLSETITIYLAAGAPFGVASFLHGQPAANRALALLKAAGATLLWPLAASAILVARQRRKDETPHARERLIDATAGEKVERAGRELLASIYRVYEMAQEFSIEGREKMERATCLIRESIEKYVGLAMAAIEINSDDAPGRREMELCRIAGRTGDDLLLAGLCIRRRNVARINEHYERARAELVHTLAEVREMVDTTSLSARTNSSSTTRLSQAILESYGHAVELFSLLDDQSAAMSVARLLDVECARLRRLEASIAAEARGRPFGEEPCETLTPHLALRGISQRSSLNQG